MKTGFTKIPNEIRDMFPGRKNLHKIGAAVDLIAMADYKTGEIYCTNRFLSTRWDWPQTTVWRFLKAIKVALKANGLKIIESTIESKVNRDIVPPELSTGDEGIKSESGFGTNPKKKKDIDKKESYDSYQKSWNLLAQEIPINKILKLSDLRRAKLKARMTEPEFDWDAILDAVRRSTFAHGKNWFTFDFIVHSQTNYLKILEGKYFDQTVGGSEYQRLKEGAARGE
ncbi:hypothetical protein LCGC14_1119790 [marine sediment metagenome]|uniref:Uncharacterized protein n=1 Tax=marine sediment metagenome TaxID=412755 RepID=A0A0F9QA27_9ZZZZ